MSKMVGERLMRMLLRKAGNVKQPDFGDIIFASNLRTVRLPDPKPGMRAGGDWGESNQDEST